MCGICGKLNFASERKVELDLIKKMTDVLEHRGPDDEGVYVKGPVGMGHRRLKIIDLDGGKQPMFNTDGTLVVVFNGEIYNYQELRHQLLKYGHIFKSSSDTEVLLHGYEQWGVEFVNKLRGMFAFALWDETQKTLILFRDRLGIKPLYYYVDDEKILFASEIKSIIQDKTVIQEIDYQALDDFLSYMYIPAPKTIFKNIKKLHPGHFLIVNNGTVQEFEYWDISFEQHNGYSESDLIDGLRNQLKDSVNVRLMSDVPLGAFLSGGIDSSAVVGTMASLTNQTINTASIGFEEAAFNELPYARLVSEKYNTAGYEKNVNPDAANILNELAWYFDEPFADSSMVPTYYVSKVARENVTVCLSGDGGDENFAGYRRYRFDYLENQIRSLLPQAFRRPVFGTLGRVYPKADWLPQIFRAKTLFKNLSLSPERAYYNSMTWFNPNTKSKLYQKFLKDQLGDYDSFQVMQRYFDRVKDLDPLSRVQYVDMKTYLVDDILTKVDRASMAHSLEVRVPLLDHQFMQFAATIPHNYKLKSGEGKYIFKKALRGIVPDAVMDRPKQGFSIPLAKWFCTDLRNPFEDRLFDKHSFASQVFVLPQIKKMWEQHQRGTRDYAYHLWALLMLECWAKKNI